MKFRAAGLALLTIFLTTCLSAEPVQTTIKVVVTNQYSKPVDNAAVILDFLGSRNYAKRAGIIEGFIGS